MKTAIQIAKIRAVVLYIMQSFTQGVDYIKLFKILYFAQQDHLVKYGKVIVEDSFRALKHGPVPAYTYKALQIAEGKPLDGNFDEFLSDIEVRDKKVYTSAVPDMDYISGAKADCQERFILNQMDDKTGPLERLKATMAKAEQVDMSSVKIGDIIYVPLDEEDGLILKDGYKDRNKYIVIIGFTPEGVAIGALLINSEIDSSKRSEELLDCQHPLMVRNYRDILDYDSWLDCSDIFELSKLKITEKNGKLKGCLISEDRERVMQFLRETEVFDNATKRRYGIIK